MGRHSAGLLLLSLVLFAAAANAQQGARPAKHPLTDLPPAGDIATKYHFFSHPDRQIPAGDKVKVSVGIHNNGIAPYNISAIMGSLNSPSDFRIFLLNFTQTLYFTVLPSEEELSVEYVFQPDPLLSPREFQVALTVFYEDLKGGLFSTTFFNDTVGILEQKRLVDTDLIFMYLTLAALVALAGYYAHKQLVVMGFVKKSKKSVSVSTGPKTDDDDWIKGTSYEVHQKKKALRSAAKSQKQT